MKKIYLVICLLFLSLVLFGCGDDNKTEEKEVLNGTGNMISKEYKDIIGSEFELGNIFVKTGNDYHKVRVFFHNSTEKKIIVTGQKEIIDDITVTSKEGEIHVDGSYNKYYETSDVKVEVYGYTLSSIELHNAEGNTENGVLAKLVEIELEDCSNFTISEFNGDKMEADIEGGSSLTIVAASIQNADFILENASQLNILELDSANLNVALDNASQGSINVTYAKTVVKLENASQLTLTGSTAEFNAELSGASQLLARGYVAASLAVTLEGASIARTTVSTTLRYSLTGASTLFYKGNPDIMVDMILDSSSRVVNDN